MNGTDLDFNDLETAFSSMPDRDLRRANFIFSLINYRFIYHLGIGLTKVGLALHLPIKVLIRKTVFNHFCGGESITDCDRTIERLNRYGVKTILDYSVEGENSEEGFDKTRDEILRVIKKAATNDAIPFSVFKMTGMASSSVLKRASSGAPLTEVELAAFEKIRKRVDDVCGAAAAVGLPIMIDAEETWIQKAIDDLCMDMMRKYNNEKVIVFNTYQMYRVDSLERLMKDHRALKGEGKKMGAKLVRGAYMEKERDRAEEKGYPSPIHPSKKDTDRCFDDGLLYCAKNSEDLAVMCGSHNETSNKVLAQAMSEMGIDCSHPHFWFAQLFGMSDNISFNLAKQGFNVTKYVPYGPVRSVMPYLFRRAEENTSVEGQSSRELMMIRKELARRSSDRG